MLNKKELRLVNNSYFNTIRCVDELDYVEVQSRNTHHYWIIRKFDTAESRYPFVLYHKHPGQKYYHCHWKSFQMAQVVKAIIDHDSYVLRKNA